MCQFILIHVALWFPIMISLVQLIFVGHGRLDYIFLIRTHSFKQQVLSKAVKNKEEEEISVSIHTFINNFIIILIKSFLQYMYNKGNSPLFYSFTQLTRKNNRKFPFCLERRLSNLKICFLDGNCSSLCSQKEWLFFLFSYI